MMDPEYLLRRARETRESAAATRDADSKKQLLQLAETYDRLAKAAQEDAQTSSIA